MDNSKSIRNNLTLFFLLALLPLGASPSRQGLAFQEMRITVEELSYDVGSQRVDIDLMEERLAKLEQKITALKTDTSQAPASDPRVSALEKKQEALLTDLKSLQKDLATLSSQVVGVKTSLQSMLSLLGNSQEKQYTVKEGDSLGKIALQHKVSIKSLKEHNQLTTDRIYTGQKLLIP